MILFWEDHEVYRAGLPPALERLGQEVWIPSPEERGGALAALLAQRKPELILSMGWTSWSADGPGLTAIREYSRAHPETVHIYWSTEDPIHTDVWVIPHLEFVRPDLVLTIAPGAVEDFRRLGFAAAEMPFAAIMVSPAKALVQPRVDIALVATLYGGAAGKLRNLGLVRLLEPLMGQSWTVGIWGHGWQESRRYLGFQVPPQWLHPPLGFGAVPGMYQTARFVLGPQNDPNQLTSRTFEALGSGGGVLLTLRTPGVSRFFTEGRHLLASGSPEETVRVLRRYLRDDRSRSLISAQGRQAVAQRHTYDHRAADILNWAERIRLQKQEIGRQALHRVCIQRVPVSPSREAGGIRGRGDSRSLHLRFALPDAIPGARLIAARLRCFAEAVLESGPVLCEDEQDTLLDVATVAADAAAPYPFTENWFSFDVTERVRGRAEIVHVALVPARRTRVSWFVPGAESGREMVRYRAGAFHPRLELMWDCRPTDQDFQDPWLDEWGEQLWR